MAASQAAWGSPSARKRPHSRSPSPARVTLRARPAEHECAWRPKEPSAPPPPRLRLQGGGGAQPKRLQYVKRAGWAEPALPALPAPPRGSRRARGSTWGTAVGVMSAGGASGWTHTHGGGSTASTSPPPSLPRAGGYFWGHLPLANGGAGGVISHKGGHRPPPPPLGVAEAGGGGRSKGRQSTPIPIPRGAARRGRRQRPPQHRWSWTNLPPKGPCRGNQGSYSPPPPHRKGHNGLGGNE